MKQSATVYYTYMHSVVKKEQRRSTPAQPGLFRDIDSRQMSRFFIYFTISVTNHLQSV